ncbi:hypothetical protein TWF730_004555 [Orbilia blumenaviensis]|uniref:Fungal N-terminal domain-containing protein n=1 Tax=Orbilia blumenaviensis TaxID=1796055 RepID=A0AAV9TZ14_9PEZI
METAAGIIGLIGFGFQLCTMIDNIVSSYRSSASELSNISSNILMLCDVLEVLEKRLKPKRVIALTGGGNSHVIGATTRALTQGGADPGRMLSTQLTPEEAVLSESQACLQNVLDKCWSCLLDIQRLLEPFRNASGGGTGKGVLVRFKWMRKKSDVQIVMANLESCKSTLSLTLLVMRYCTEDDERVDPKDIALAIQKQAEQLKSEKDENYAFVMQRYLDCASSTIGSPKSTLVQSHGNDDVKSFVLDDIDKNDGASDHSTDFEIDSASSAADEDEDNSLDSFSIPGLRSEASQASLLSVTVYQKVGNERKEQRRRKRQSKDSGCVIEDDDISILSQESMKWQPFLSLGYKLEWYRRNFRQDLNGRLTSIQQLTDTCEFNIQELLARCKPTSRPVTPVDNPLSNQGSGNSQNQLRKKMSNLHLLSRSTPLKPREEDFFRGIVRIQKALANLSSLRANALTILSAAPVLIRSSSLPITIHTKSSVGTSSRSNNNNDSAETPLRPYVLDALQILLTIHTLSEQLHQKLQELTSHRDQTSKSSILSRLSLSNDITRFEYTKRTFSNIEAKVSLSYAQEKYTRAKELWDAAHDVINAALEAEFFFFDDMDRILSAAIAEPLVGYNNNKLTRSKSLGLESDMSDSDVNRGYSALVASAERQKSYTVLDHKLRGLLLAAKSEVAIAEGKVDFIPVNGRTLQQVIGNLEEQATEEREKLEEVFKYLNEYVHSYVAGTMGRLDVGMAKFGERLYIPLRRTVLLE